MEALDTIDPVAAKKDDESESRSRTIPIYGAEFEWWTLAVRRQLDSQGMDQKDLATKLKVHPGNLSKCINRKVPTFDLLIAICDELKIAYPVILPESEAEAVYLAKEKRLFKREAEAKKIKAGVGDRAVEDQPPPVVSEHASRSQKEKGQGKGTARRTIERP